MTSLQRGEVFAVLLARTRAFEAAADGLWVGRGCPLGGVAGSGGRQP